jgi:hypothetical protein
VKLELCSAGGSVRLGHAVELMSHSSHRYHEIKKPRHVVTAEYIYGNACAVSWKATGIWRERDPRS